MERMTFTQLSELYDAPRDHVRVSLSRSGVWSDALNRYDPIEAGEALATYYRDRSRHMKVKYENRTVPTSHKSLELSEMWQARAEKIEARLKTLTAEGAEHD